MFMLKRINWGGRKTSIWAVQIIPKFISFWLFLPFAGFELERSTSYPRHNSFDFEPRRLANQTFQITKNNKILFSF